MALIILIDDDPILREIVEVALRRVGHEVFSAVNGKDGVQLCSAHPPDLVITDILMPEKEGLESIQEIRAKFPILPVLAVSGAPDEWKVLDLAKRLGADESIAKPFAPEELLARVHSLLTAAST